jgi:O-antigen/teichoic acid export membrane protein
LERHRIALRGSSLRVLSLLATTLIGFFLMPFLVHRLGERNYGYWVLVAAVLGYYGLLDLGIITAVQYEVAKSLGDKDPESVNRTISTAFYAFAMLGMAVFVLTVAVAYLSKFYIASASDISLFRKVLLITGAGFAVGFPGRAFMGATAAHLRFDITASIGILVLIARSALILAIIGGGGGVVSLALISFFTETANYVLGYFALRRIQEGLRISTALASWRTFRGLFHYSGHALVIQISDQIRFSIDGWMVGAFVGVSAVTHYAIAGRLSQAFLALIIAIVGILSPWFSQLFGSADFDGIRRVFILGTKVSASVSTIVALSLIFYGHVFIEKWMGQRYLDAYVPLVLLVLGIYCDVSQLPSVSYMFGVSRHRFLAGLTLAEAISNFGLSVYWARHYGMIGVALGTLVPIAIAKILIQPFYVCRHLQISIGGYYVKLFGRSVVAPALISTFLWMACFRKLNLPNVGMVCAVIILQALICAMAAFFFIFDKTERNSMLKQVLGLLQASQPANAGGAVEITEVRNG